eukprot:1001008-Amphidinium_carterae.1
MDEKHRMETIMKDIQVQPWWQYKADITMFSEMSVKDAMNKELSQLLSKQSFKEVDSRNLNDYNMPWQQDGYTFVNGNASTRLLLTIAIVKQLTVFTTDVASAFLNTSIDEEVLAQPPKEYYHNHPHILWKMTKALYGLRTSPKHWQEHLSTILQQLGLTRGEADLTLSERRVH